MEIPKHFFKELLENDPFSFEKMFAALEQGTIPRDILRISEEKIGKLTGLTNEELKKNIEHAVKRKAWLLRSIKERAMINKSINKDDKLNLFRGLLLTRATDNALKRLFLSGEITYEGKGFQGKGFRSLGQEAVFGAPYKLNQGAPFIKEGVYVGDVAAPLIRDLGVFLAMSDGDVATAINAQAGKSGKPCQGRDLHIGDFSKGLLMPAAPLAIATCTLIGMALTFKMKNEARVGVSFIGEGGSSLGAWHEAINFASVLNLPMIFCIQNNQTALSTPVSAQSRVRTFADKAVGYGINGLVVDGNDVEAITSAFKFAADEARKGLGPVLIELVTMRMCGHAHHDDMLYLGKDPNLDFEIEAVKGGGYVDEQAFEVWRAQDPIKRYQEELIRENYLNDAGVKHLKEEALSRVNEAVSEVMSRPWPKFTVSDDALVFKAPWVFTKHERFKLSPIRFAPDGMTYLQAIAEGTKRSFQKHHDCIVIGEDVAPPYGNAFMMFRPFMNEYSERFINTPISENAIVGACVGMALGGMRPIGEIQFNDFVACAMDQVVNSAAKTFFRMGLNLPMVLRLPYGGMRRAGPFHSQDTSPWFYQTPGLKIMAPSNPSDAMCMLMKAVDDPDPVLFFEHIALYRDPKIRQQLPLDLRDFVDGAALVNEGVDLTLISYGAYVHNALNAARLLFDKHGYSADVIDLRYLMPIDFDALHASLKKTSRVLLVGEDKKTGGILEMIASKIGEEGFFDLDAPVTVLGSRNTPVPYAPSLEDDYLLSEKEIISEALKLIEM